MALRLLCLLLLVAWASVAAAEKTRCDICGKIVANFAVGMMTTKKKNFGGGNSDWEKQRLGQYSKSETRLAEVYDMLCEQKDHDCYAVVEEADEEIENWWKARQSGEEIDSLFKHICVDYLKLCCLGGYYGKSCKACPGGAQNECSGHGKCGGSGTRKGNGKCACEEGYEGKACDKCKQGYYLTQSGADNKFSCQPCHAACSGCVGPDIQHCTGCKEGYSATGKQGCVDIDECTLDNPCVVGEHCVNTPGSHECRDCDRSCARDSGCRGAGPSNCTACADGFTLNSEGACTDINECQTETCPVGKYCNNVPGSFACAACDPLCSSAGCHGSGSHNCEACKEGYVFHTTGHFCQDVDECASYPCEPGFTCLNTDGSYQCNCTAPNILENGVCRPERTEL